MGFDYRELMTQVLADQGEKQPCPGVSCAGKTKDDVPDCEQCQTTKDHPLGCELCNTTKPGDIAPGCELCSTTKPKDEPGCNQCNTTKKYADDSWSQYAQDLTFLRQQLRDALSAG